MGNEQASRQSLPDTLLFLTWLTRAVSAIPGPALLMSALLTDRLDRSFVDTFSFEPDHIPLSTHKSVATVILVYLVVVYALKDYIRHRGKPYDLRSISVVYNAALSLMSAYLLYQHCAVMHRLLSNQLVLVRTVRREGAAPGGC